MGVRDILGRLRRLFRKEERAPEILPVHPFRVPPALLESDAALAPEVVSPDLPPSLQSLLERKRSRTQL